MKLRIELSDFVTRIQWKIGLDCRTSCIGGKLKCFRIPKVDRYGVLKAKKKSQRQYLWDFFDEKQSILTA